MEGMFQLKLSRKQQESILKDVQHNNLASLQELKIKHPNFHWCTISYQTTGNTALHLLAKLDHVNAINSINYLLDEDLYQPCIVDIRNKDDKTPLHEAAQFTQLNSVVALCSHGANVNALRRGDWTPLMLACTKIEPGVTLEIVKVLVELGAEINIQNKDGWSCAHLLARTGCGEVFDYLVESGLNVNVRTKNGRTPIHIAALHGNQEIVTRLLEGHVDVNCKDGCGNTPIHEALLGQHIDLAKFLVEKGADVKSRNNSDFSVLHLVASQDNVEVVDYVLKELNFDYNTQNVNGWTAAHCAARKGCKKVLQHLRNLGFDLCQKDRFDRTAMDYLQLEGDIDY